MTAGRLRRPEEGWLTLGLVMLMCLVMASALDDPAWVNGRAALTDGLVWFAAFGVIVGFMGPKVGWSRWTTHVVGALFAGLLIPVVAGFAEWPGSSIGVAFSRTAADSVQAYLDIAWLRLPFTSREVHYTVVLGIIVWGTSQFASYAVFGHRRPLNAVVVAGLVLVTNMALTFNKELPYLVLFTGAAMFLLIEMHAFDERATWIRRRIGDPGTISSLYLRGGTVFIVAAMLGSLFLTERAASSPLAGAWDGVNSRLIEFSETFSGLLPVGGDIRGLGGVTFDDAPRISGQWTPGTGVAFRAIVPVGAPDNLYWRVRTYDQFVGTGWRQTSVTRDPIPANQLILADTNELPPAEITAPIAVQIQRETYRAALLVVPGAPVSVDGTSDLLLVGDDSFGGVEQTGDRGDFTIQARRLRLEDDSVISAHRLERADENYPAEIKKLYTDVPPDALGPDSLDLLARVKALAASPDASASSDLAASPDASGSPDLTSSPDPYDLADAMARYLASPVFAYDTDIRDLPCAGLSTVECLARYKHGYCLHFASTMAILLRHEGIPTRLVQGFLPGTRKGTVTTVNNADAHAWVEVYFPGYGWIPFDPTGHDIGKASSIKVGPVLPSIAPTPRASGAGASRNPLPAREGDGSSNGGAGGSGRSQPGDRTLFILLTIAVAVLVGGLALAAWLRGPRGEITPDRAWISMSRAATRLGFGPRPTQTVYEYAATLGDLVPVARADLALVADAKVETTYARRGFGGDRLVAIDRAARRLRISLLRLVFRRGRRRRRPVK